MRYKLVAGMIFLTTLVAACTAATGVSDEEAIERARLTLEASLTQNAARDPAQPMDEQVPAVTEGAALIPTETALPSTATMTLSPTSSVPSVSVSIATNCRSGPGLAYGLLDILNPGQRGIITAQSSVSNYVLIQSPGGGPDCWLWLQYATITGNIGNLPLVTPPPSPTPTITPTPTIDWTGAWMTDSGTAQFTLNITQNGNVLSASEVVNAITVTINAVLSANSRTATGTWTQDNGFSGTFVWQLLPGTVDQFNGNWVNVPGPGGNQWCGFRNGAGYPNPCAGP